MTRSILRLSLVATLMACGSSHMGGAGSADAQAFDAAAQSVSSAAIAYRESTATMPDAAACRAAETAYQAQVRPAVQRMHESAGTMDDRMSSMMGQAGSSDMACATDAMTAELDRHHGVACASASDMLPNQAEADRHARWMIAWADHQRARAGQVISGSMQGGGMMGGAPATGTCQRAADGNYTMMGAPMQMPLIGVQGFHALARDIATAATAYGAAAATMSDLAACSPAETAYDGQVRPIVQQMRVLARDMDATMGSLGQAPLGDMSCGSDALLAELDRHRAAACGSDLSAAKAEAARHVQTMTSWTEHQRIRSEQMGALMDAGSTMGTGGTTGTCQRDGDGTFAAR